MSRLMTTHESDDHVDDGVVALRVVLYTLLEAVEGRNAFPFDLLWFSTTYHVWLV